MKKHLQPEAPVVKIATAREGSRGTVVLLTVRCPHCGETHQHGGGIDPARAVHYLGHRASHCSSSTGYQLTDPDGLLP